VEEYGNLNYRGDVTSNPRCQPGAPLGYNELRWPWKVIDAEYDIATDRTVVHLVSASPDDIRHWMAESAR